MTTEEKRREIIDCLHNWKVSYQVTGNQTVIDKSIRELVGEEKVIWFDYSQTDEFVNNEECEKLGFDAKTELNGFLKIINNQNNSWDTIRKRVFKQIAEKSFSLKLTEISGEETGSNRRERLIKFIKQCEHCYFISVNDLFIQLAKNAKKVDFQLNDWIQSRAYDEIGVINNPTIDEISDNFIKIIAEPKIEIVIPPPSYVITERDNINTHWLKTWYSKYGWQTHIGIFCIFSILFWLISKEDYFFLLLNKNESLLLLECVLAATLVNILIWLWFKFFYQEKAQ